MWSCRGRGALMKLRPVKGYYDGCSIVVVAHKCEYSTLLLTNSHVRFPETIVFRDGELDKG